MVPSIGTIRDNLESLAASGALGDMQPREVGKLNIADASSLWKMACPGQLDTTEIGPISFTTKSYTEADQELIQEKTRSRDMHEKELGIQNLSEEDKAVFFRDQLEQLTQNTSQEKDHLTKAHGLESIMTHLGLVQVRHSNVLLGKALPKVMTISAEFFRNDKGEISERTRSRSSMKDTDQAIARLLSLARLPSQKTIKTLEDSLESLEGLVSTSHEARYNERYAHIALRDYDLRQIERTTLNTWPTLLKEADKLLLVDALEGISEALHGQKHIRKKTGLLGH